MKHLNWQKPSQHCQLASMLLSQHKMGSQKGIIRVSSFEWHHQKFLLASLGGAGIPQFLYTGYFTRNDLPSSFFFKKLIFFSAQKLLCSSSFLQTIGIIHFSMWVFVYIRVGNEGEKTKWQLQGTRLQRNGKEHPFFYKCKFQSLYEILLEMFMINFYRAIASSRYFQYGWWLRIISIV